MDRTTNWKVWLSVLLVILIIAVIIWKIVTAPPPPPSLSLAIDKTSLQTGSNLVISGTLLQGTTPLSGKQVSILLTPPSGDPISLTATTTTTGAYSVTWTAVSPTGSWTVEAAYTGATTQSKTFTQMTAMM